MEWWNSSQSCKIAYKNIEKTNKQAQSNQKIAEAITSQGLFVTVNNKKKTNATKMTKTHRKCSEIKV